MKKSYIKPEILFVDLITEGEFCCSKGTCADCLDEEEEDEGSAGGSDDNVFASVYRYPIWED